MSILADIRREYPEFRDMSDRELTEVLRKKYYSDMPEKEFRKQISTPTAFPESKYIPPAVKPVTTAEPTPSRRATQSAGLPELKEVKPAGLFDYFTNREQAIKQDREYRSYLQERQQRETLEDLKTNTGFMDFVGDLFSSGLLNLRSGIKDVEATIERNPELKKKFQEEARRYAKNANAEVAGAMTTEDVKENWLKVVPFALQEFARSAPSLVAMPLGAVGLAGQVARGRAEANGREDVSGTDLAIAAPVAAVSTVLDRFGLGEIIGAAGKNAVIRTVKAFGAEGTTEGAQELIEYLGSRVGTEKGADAREAFEQAMWGAIIGGTAGGTLRGAGELVSAPFRKPAQEQSEQDIAASPQGIAEFQRLAGEAVGQVMAANPGMSRNDAVNIVMEQAEKLRIQAVANVLGTEGEPDVDTRLDVTGGGRAGVPTDLEPGGAAVGAAEFGEADTGRMGEPVSGVPVSDVGAGAREPALRKATAEEIKAAIPLVEEAFDAAAIDFEDNYGVTDLTGAQKQMAARMVVEGVDVFDAIDNLLQKQARAPSLDQQAVAPVKQVVETVTAPKPGAAVPSIEETAAKQTGIAPATTVTGPANAEELQAQLNANIAAINAKADEARAAIQAQAAQAPSEELPAPATVEETVTEEKVATPAEKTLNDLAGAGSVNPENTNEVLIEGGGVQLTPVADNVVQVDSLRAVETGGGRKAMEQLVQMADANGTELQLSPEPFAAPAGKEMSPTELTEWYKGFGFQEQPDGSMVRPAAAPPSTITPSPREYTAQEIADNLTQFAADEARDRGYEDNTPEHSMFREGARDISRGAEPLADEQILERNGPEVLQAYKEGMQWAQDRKADAAKAAQEPVAEEAQEPITDESVDKAVSVKLTKAQMKRLETAAGIRRKELSNMQKRIVQSRNTNETLGLIGRLTKLAHSTNDAGILASIARSMPPPVYRFLLGFQQIETVFAVARNAGIKSLEKVDDLMRNGYIPYVNRIIMSAREIDEMWGDFASKNEAGNIALDDVIMISNMMNVDPSQAATAADYMLIDEDLRGLQWKLIQSKDEGEKKSLRNQIGRRKEEIKRVYFGGQETTETGETVQVAGWNDVPPEGRKIYTAARDFYRSNFNEHYRLLMQRIDDAGLDKEDSARVKSSIKKMFEKARERVIYFPVKRFGEYWVSVGNDFYMRESLAEQEALVDRLEKEGETREITAAYGRENLRNLVANKDASGALKDILDLLDDSNTPNADGTAKITDMDDLRDLVFQMYLTALPEADMRRRFIHREFKTGFSTDALRTFASTAVASANQLGRLAYNYKFDAAIAQAKKETEKNPMKAWLDTLTNEVELKVKGVMSPQQDDLLDAVIAFANKLTFFNLLSAPSSAFMNLTQLHIVGLPVLSAEFGEAKTAAMATRYTTSFLLGQEIPNPLRNEEGNIEFQAPDFRFENSGYMRRLKESDPERYEQTLAAWNFAKEHDVIESTFSAGSELYQRSNVPTGDFTFRQAARRGQVLTAAQRATANTINGMGYMFHKSEVIGRSIMYMSSFDLAYERAIKEGKSPEEAGKEARSLAAKLTNKGMFDFSNWNKSRFAQTRFGRLALQMQSYRQSMNMLLFRSFVRMLPLMNKEGKLAAARVFFGVAGMTALYGGLRATHISGLLLGAYTVLKFVESLADDDDDEEKEIEQDYLTEGTIEKELMKFADENGNELAMKDAEYYIRAHWIPETFGRGSTLQQALNLKDETADKLAAVADMGLPALGGIDLSNSVALNEFWTPVEAKGNTPEVRALETLARYGLGPTAASLAQYVKAAQAWNEGDIEKGFEAVLPAIIRNQIKSERLQSEGLRVGKNEDIVLKDPTYYTSGKSALISMGFRDAETSRNMQLDIAAGKIEDEVAAEKTKLLDRRYRAILDFEANPSKENEREWNRAERAIDIYNLNYPSNAISVETKRKSLRAKRREAADKAYGLGYDKDIPIRMPLVEERVERMAPEE